MKCFVRKIVLFVALCVTTIVAGYAQEPSKAEIKVKDLVKRYENVKGVECMTVVKGKGLEMVKMMFNKQFGRDFMKGVTSITIISYADASDEVCQALRQEIDSFSSLLDEFKLNKDEVATEHTYARSYASVSENKSISDFITAMESGESKIMMYMAGVIKVE